MNIEGKVNIEGDQFNKLFRLLNDCTEDSANARIAARMYINDLLTQAFNKGRQVERADNGSVLKIDQPLTVTLKQHSNEDIECLARTGHTTGEQNAWFAGIEEGRRQEREAYNETSEGQQVSAWRAVFDELRDERSFYHDTVRFLSGKAGTLYIIRQLREQVQRLREGQYVKKRAPDGYVYHSTAQGQDPTKRVPFWYGEPEPIGSKDCDHV